MLRGYSDRSEERKYLRFVGPLDMKYGWFKEHEYIDSKREVLELSIGTFQSILNKFTKVAQTKRSQEKYSSQNESLYKLDTRNI